jgi:hypothetical protein
VALGVQIYASGLRPTTWLRQVLNLPDFEAFANGCGKYRTHYCKVFVGNLICGGNFLEPNCHALHQGFELIELLARYGRCLQLLDLIG